MTRLEGNKISPTSLVGMQNDTPSVARNWAAPPNVTRAFLLTQSSHFGDSVLKIHWQRNPRCCMLKAILCNIIIHQSQRLEESPSVNHPPSNGGPPCGRARCGSEEGVPQAALGARQELLFSEQSKVKKKVCGILPLV